ncbi:MAG TPA: glycoside hydrolase family 15 protein [Methylocystis sp.]|nr:glycoside hydrolase family 15 protein [Methylocystis sp.]
MTDPNGLLDWCAEQYRFSAEAMLRAVSATGIVKHRPQLGQTIRPARGSILASPEIASYDPNPDYFFHWLRDSAIVADALREFIEDQALPASAVDHLVDFVDFSLELCRLDGPAFLRRGDFRGAIDPAFLKNVRSDEEIAAITGDRALGEVRYNADGGFDLLKWSRPQNDGPALRALSVLRFFRIEAFRRRGGERAAKLLERDLDYTCSHWREPCYDLWEEVSGRHYYTRLVQYAALAEGAPFMAARGDVARVEACRRAAEELFPCLDDHFDPGDGVYLSRLPEAPEPPSAAPARRLDIATALAVIHTNRTSGPHSVVDPKMLATMARIEQLFAKDYRINRERPSFCAPALGRYAGDVYYSGGAYYFSTLGAAQFYFLLAEAAAQGREISAALENRDALAALLGEAPAQGALAALDRKRLARAAFARGDMFLAMVRRHTPDSREMSEQFDQNDGSQTSAKNLAWSYACFVTAVATRARALRVLGD